MAVAAKTAAGEPVTPLNRIVAVVNDEIITQTELDSAIDQFQQQLIANKDAPPPPNKLRDEVLQQLINYHLQKQMAARYDIKPTDEELDQTIEQIAKSHNMTVEQLKQQLQAQHLNYTEFRQKLYDQLVINKLQQQMVMGKVKVTDADITAFKAAGKQEYRLVDFFCRCRNVPLKKK